MRVIDVHGHVWREHAEANRRELREAVEAVPRELMYVSGLKGELQEPEVVTQINDAVHVLLKECPRVRGWAYLTSAPWRSGPG